MGRGVSYGGGQSSLGYLFGSGEPPKSASQPAVKVEPAADNVPAHKSSSQPAAKVEPAADNVPANKSAAVELVDNGKQIPAGIQGSQANNYFRAEGQNCGNFITDRPSTKVHAAPGGGSSLDYLFGNGSGGK